mgnify:CR=1 FL=1
MNNYSNILFPEIINEAFPVLDGASYVRQLASLVPLCPDTAFHLFADENGCFFTLVMTDYPDPTSQSTELKQISGEYEFEFTHLIKPYANDKHIAICENDEMNEQFSVPGPNSYYHYYLAVVNMNITHHLVTAIRTNDLSAYQRIRYPAIPDGELVRLLAKTFLMWILISLSWDFSHLKIVIWTVQSIFTGNRFISRIRRFGMWIFVVLR